MNERIKVFKFISKALFLSRKDRSILKCLANKGVGGLYPGDVVKDLKMSHCNGIKKIIRLREKGYIITEEASNKICINPYMKLALALISLPC